MRVEIFTASFRKVSTQDFGAVPSGSTLTLHLTDDHGAPLADGVYYVLVIVDGKRAVTKLLILR
jgi:hypothetical protein